MVAILLSDSASSARLLGSRTRQEPPTHHTHARAHVPHSVASECNFIWRAVAFPPPSSAPLYTSSLKPLLSLSHPLFLSLWGHSSHASSLWPRLLRQTVGQSGWSRTWPVLRFHLTEKCREVDFVCCGVRLHGGIGIFLSHVKPTLSRTLK